MTQEGTSSGGLGPWRTVARFSRARTSPALTTEWGHSTQTTPRDLAALVPSRPASRCLLPDVARAPASICAPCALKSLQRSSAPITCLPIRLVGLEPDGVGGGIRGRRTQ